MRFLNRPGCGARVTVINGEFGDRDVRPALPGLHKRCSRVPFQLRGRANCLDTLRNSRIAALLKATRDRIINATPASDKQLRRDGVLSYRKK
jgi:hypothetical protein